MKKIIIIAIAGIVILAAAGFLIFYRNQINRDSSDVTSEANVESQKRKAPGFELQDYNGKTVSISDFAGKPLVINSWAAWCPFCKKELVDFALAQEEFGDKVVIIAVDRSETGEVAKKYTDELGVSDKMVFLLDPSDSFYQSIGGFAMPETIFVDEKGNIVLHKRGPMDLNEIRQRINNLIAG